jgi:hypothetical protein
VNRGPRFRLRARKRRTEKKCWTKPLKKRFPQAIRRLSRSRDLNSQKAEPAALNRNEQLRRDSEKSVRPHVDFYALGGCIGSPSRQVERGLRCCRHPYSGRPGLSPPTLVTAGLGSAHGCDPRGIPPAWPGTASSFQNVSQPRISTKRQRVFSHSCVTDLLDIHG